MSVRPFWKAVGRIGLVRVVIIIPFPRLAHDRLILLPLLLLSQQLLGLHQNPGIDSVSEVAIPGALVTGISGIVLCTLKPFARGVAFIPSLLTHGTGVLFALPWQ